ncbi:MAG: hypothetical protein SNH13_06780 [Rikenellaceae bacterium]
MGKKIIIRISVMLAIALTVSLFVMLLWNLLIPSITGWSVINFWQSLGLVILSRLLLGNWQALKHKAHSKLSQEERSEINEQLKGMSKEQKLSFIKSYMTQKKHDK